MYWESGVRSGARGNDVIGGVLWLIERTREGKCLPVLWEVHGRWVDGLLNRCREIVGLASKLWV